MARFWNGIKSEPPEPPGPADNVVPMPVQTLDEIEHEIQAATHDCVHWEAEAHKVEAGIRRAFDRKRRAQAKMAERLAHLGMKVEFPMERDDVASRRPEAE